MTTEFDFDRQLKRFNTPIANWELLDSTVDKIHRVYGNSKPSYYNPNFFTVKTIDELIQDGWKVTTVRNNHGIYGMTSGVFREIVLNDIEVYQRDKTLMHEIIHAVRMKNRSYRFPSLEREISTAEHIVLEWQARLYRTDPELLRKAVLDFGLEPDIYDFVSYQAFARPGNNFGFQPALMKLKGLPQTGDIKKVFMD